MIRISCKIVLLITQPTFLQQAGLVRWSRLSYLTFPFCLSSLQQPGPSRLSEWLTTIVFLPDCPVRYSLAHTNDLDNFQKKSNQNALFSAAWPIQIVIWDKKCTRYAQLPIYKLFIEQASRAHGVCIGTSDALLYSHKQKAICNERRVMIPAVNVLSYFTLYFVLLCTLSGTKPVIRDIQGDACNSVDRLTVPCILNSLQSMQCLRDVFVCWSLLN